MPGRRRRVPRRRRAARARARPGHEPALPRVLRGRAAGRLPAHERRQRLPPGGVRRLRPQHPPRPPAERRPGVPAPGHGPAEPDGEDERVRAPDRLRGQHARRASRSTCPAARRGGRTRGEIIVCGGAINSPQLLQLSGVGNAAELEALGVDVVHDLPGVGENLQDHLEVYVQYGSKLPVSVAPAMLYRNRPKVYLQWLARARRRRHQPLRGRRLCPLERRGRLPEPDVPLPAARDPLRRLQARRRPRLPGAHRADVLGHPRRR